jgi:hypothetical protein
VVEELGEVEKRETLLLLMKPMQMTAFTYRHMYPFTHEEFVYNSPDIKCANARRDMIEFCTSLKQQRRAIEFSNNPGFTAGVGLPAR